MKLTNLIWVLALAGAAVASCDSGPPVNGCPPGQIVNNDGLCVPQDGTGGTGGTSGTGGGTGGTGGMSVGGACTNPDDAAVYMDLEYLNDDGMTETGSDAASAIASDCVFGSQNSDPKNPGCGQEAQAVLICAVLGCPQETIDALTVCVEECTQQLIEEITGSTLSGECMMCYGDSVSCSAANCASEGCSNPTSATCVACRCREDCTPGFDRCSGLPASGDCD
ncbi:MAG: hypothetical protein JRJ10_08125 [Deltaproteobacteria bacterium]|nr:hypothetical protein [Deltaproteobacteria bacterium]MBW2223359.1 hypothetical protein [Deltaproteobacteria bacterium]MBW2403980.1 hypothetical protein [Deltaproteobacteria bacterium]MBW2548482.1 hypothetical protein [Deltaproteobacteria bacterium]MBW2719701.1 hypothetical protein [Deltaproteobacteria bacterium]